VLHGGDPAWLLLDRQFPHLVAPAAGFVYAGDQTGPYSPATDKDFLPGFPGPRATTEARTSGPQLGAPVRLSPTATTAAFRPPAVPVFPVPDAAFEPHAQSPRIQASSPAVRFIPTGLHLPWFHRLAAVRCARFVAALARVRAVEVCGSEPLAPLFADAQAGGSGYLIAFPPVHQLRV